MDNWAMGHQDIGTASSPAPLVLTGWEASQATPKAHTLLQFEAAVPALKPYFQLV
jgi:hypothetical protein